MISVIVPIYNEAEGIEKFIHSLKQFSLGEDVELIFVDGGSTDNTVQICKANDVNVLLSPERGRAHQMNYGAMMAKGDVLYFLHADSSPPQNFIFDIKSNLEKGFKAGCYQLSFTPDHFLLKLYAWFTRFDIDFFRFGDQSLFVTKKAFSEAGGFKESLKVMEDQQIVRDLKKENPFIIMDDCVKTSSRKYIKFGVIKLQLLFTLIVVLYYLGVSQDVIAHLYSNQLN